MSDTEKKGLIARAVDLLVGKTKEKMDKLEEPTVEDALRLEVEQSEVRLADLKKQAIATRTQKKQIERTAETCTRELARLKEQLDAAAQLDPPNKALMQRIARQAERHNALLTQCMENYEQIVDDLQQVENEAEDAHEELEDRRVQAEMDILRYKTKGAINEVKKNRLGIGTKRTNTSAPQIAKAKAEVERVAAENDALNEAISEGSLPLSTEQETREIRRELAKAQTPDDVYQRALNAFDSGRRLGLGMGLDESKLPSESTKKALPSAEPATPEAAPDTDAELTGSPSQPAPKSSPTLPGE